MGEPSTYMLGKREFAELRTAWMLAIGAMPTEQRLAGSATSVIYDARREAPKTRTVALNVCYLIKTDKAEESYKCEWCGRGPHKEGIPYFCSWYSRRRGVVTYWRTILWSSCMEEAFYALTPPGPSLEFYACWRAGAFECPPELMNLIHRYRVALENLPGGACRGHSSAT
jgi:hypothetical protein